MANEFDYSSLAATADRLINQFGRQCTIKRTTEVIDDDQPWRPEGDPTPIVATPKGVFLRYSQKYIDGELIHSGDMYVLVSPKVAIEPNLQGTVTDPASGDWKIIKVNPLQPGNTKMLYAIQVRQ